MEVGAMCSAQMRGGHRIPIEGVLASHGAQRGAGDQESIEVVEHVPEEAAELVWLGTGI